MIQHFHISNTHIWITLRAVDRVLFFICDKWICEIKRKKEKERKKKQKKKTELTVPR